MFQAALSASRSDDCCKLFNLRAAAPAADLPPPAGQFLKIGPGTNCGPHAWLKIFLDASAQARAERRYNQLKNKGLSVSLRDLLEQIQERDARDRERATAPLKPATDAMLIDSTQMTIQEVCNTVMQAAKQRLLSQ